MQLRSSHGYQHASGFIFAFILGPVVFLALAFILDAVGPNGTVIGVDASAGMLADAAKLIRRRGWSNVQLLRQGATELQIDGDVDGVLFSLGYSALPEPRPALALAWERLGPASRVVVMDMGLTHSRWHRLLHPPASLLVKLGPDDAYSDPWSDLAAYDPAETERFLLDFYRGSGWQAWCGVTSPTTRCRATPKP